MIPPRKKSSGRPSKYNFHLLKVNECRIIEPGDKIRATQAAYAYGKKSGKKFVQRNGGLEIWRTE